MFKQNQILKVRKLENFYNNKYNIRLNGDIENKTTKVIFNTIMQSYKEIKCPITTNSNYFKYDGWYWYDWMFKNVRKENCLLDIE